jgi:predicted kinase
VADLFVMVGIPGSGKTTYVRRHLPCALRISLDDLRLMMCGQPFDPRIEPAIAVAAEALLGALVPYAARTDTDLVFDATNVTRARRAPVIELARQHGLSPVAIFLECPLALAQHRNRQRPEQVPPDVIDRFAQRLEPPTLDEGFARIIRVPAQP